MQAYYLLVLTTLCWGINAVFARMAVGEISPMLLVSVRWLGTLVLLVIFAGKAIIADLPAIRRNFGNSFLLGTVGLGGFGTLIYYHNGCQHRNHPGGHARHRVGWQLFLFQDSSKSSSDRRRYRYHSWSRFSKVLYFMPWLP